MSEWKEYKLGDLIDVKHGFAFKGECITTEPTSNILVTPGNFNIGGGFKVTKCKYYYGQYPESYILKEGDIVVTMTDLSQEGDTLGYSAKIPKQDGFKFLHNQRIGLVNIISDEADKDFIYWMMRTYEYQGFIVGAATGTSIRHTSPTTIKEYTFQLPPLPE
ncbi:MAG: restriction endonuclease subunit S [Nitrospinae bacterium]|nr:restriction endonuclease subunit S [Nitrospinota bacterium]